MIYEVINPTKEEYLKAIKKAGQTIIDTAENIIDDFDNDKYSIKDITVSFVVEPMKIQEIEITKRYLTKNKED